MDGQVLYARRFYPTGHLVRACEHNDNNRRRYIRVTVIIICIFLYHVTFLVTENNLRTTISGTPTEFFAYQLGITICAPITETTAIIMVQRFGNEVIKTRVYYPNHLYIK